MNPKSCLLERCFYKNDSSNTNENITPSENLSSKKETSEKTSISIEETSIGRQILQKSYGTVRKNSATFF